MTFTFRDRSDSPSCYDTRSLHSFHGAICELDTVDSIDTPDHKPVGRRKTPDTLSLDLGKSNIHVSEDSITPEFESPNEDFNITDIQADQSKESNYDLPVPAENEINEEKSQADQKDAPVNDVRDSPEAEIKEETKDEIVENMFFNQIEHSFANISMIQRKEELELPVDPFLSAAGSIKIQTRSKLNSIQRIFSRFWTSWVQKPSRQ